MWRVIMRAGGPAGNADGGRCARCFAMRGFALRANSQVRHELFVRGFETRAFILVCLHAVRKSFDGLILNGEPSGIVDRAFGIVTVLTLYREQAILEASIVGAEALRNLVAIIHLRAGGDRAARDRGQHED